MKLPIASGEKLNPLLDQKFSQHNKPVNILCFKGNLLVKYYFLLWINHPIEP